MSDEPGLDCVRDRVMDAKAAAVAAIQAKRWTCDDGHKHARPERFTNRRLQQEMNRRSPRNHWSSSEMWLAIHALEQEGALVQHKDWSYSVSDGFKWAAT